MRSQVSRTEKIEENQVQGAENKKADGDALITFPVNCHVLDLSC
jgi:hypothetical protein